MKYNSIEKAVILWNQKWFRWFNWNSAPLIQPNIEDRSFLFVLFSEKIKLDELYYFKNIRICFLFYGKFLLRVTSTNFY